MILYLTLFAAGLVTILLPCILPLLPIVVGVSISGRSKWRPLLVVLGMVLSFVGFTFLLHVVLGQFVELADILRIATFYILLLFGVGFLSEWRVVRIVGVVAGGFFFLEKGIPFVIIAIVIGMFLMEAATNIAARIQQIGLKAQEKARGEFGSDSPFTAFLIGMTLGLVWVPCAGPALGFALALVREKPGIVAVLALLSYAAGSGVPLLIVGYGGQYAVRSVRLLARFTGMIKKVAGAMLIVTALALSLNLFQDLQVWLEEHTMFGSIGTNLENRLFPTALPSTTMNTSSLPKIIRAPEFAGLGPWHPSSSADYAAIGLPSIPFTLADLKGKVILVDFWTYSCINCIRTLPHIEGYWQKYKDTGKFVLLGVHTPEFTFEKSEKNVAMAIKEHGLTYPVAQDNDFGTWTAFANHYWPAKYLIDADGYVRYTHFGEGGYEETDTAIASLLAEAGSSPVSPTASSRPSEETSWYGPVTPETYLSSRSWPAFGNAGGGPTNDVKTYAIPTTLKLHSYYLGGDWQLVDDEAEALRSDTGTIAMKFQGGEINLVLGIEDGAAPVKAEVTVDGKPAGTFMVDRHDLFNLFKGEYGEHDVLLKLTGKGLQAFAFTFGG